MIDPGANKSADITQQALNIAGEGSNEINIVLQDIAGDNTLGNEGSLNVSFSTTDGSMTGTVQSGKDVLDIYGYNPNTSVDITQASGAMVIDDLMQKISTKVQVAAQLLSTANNINKAVQRKLES